MLEFKIVAGKIHRAAWCMVWITLFFGSGLLPLQAQCNPDYDYHFDYQGCTTGDKPIHFWPNGPIAYSCRQKIEARLFMQHQRMLENKVDYFNRRINDTNNDVVAYLNLIDTTMAIYDIGNTLAELPYLSLREKKKLLLEKLLDSPELAHETLENMGFNRTEAVGLTDYLNESKSEVLGALFELDSFKLTNSNIKNFTLKPGNAAFLVQQGAKAITRIWGALELTELTQEMNGTTLGWWYLEEYYRLGGTFNGTGPDAHSAVAESLGLPASANILEVIQKLALLRLGAPGPFSWLVGPNYDAAEAIHFAESIKGFVRNRLPQHLEFEASVHGDDALLFGLETQEQTTLQTVVNNPLHDSYHLCVKVRHGQITQDATDKNQFVYQGPNRPINPDNSFDSHEELVFLFSNGEDALPQTLRFSLKNQTYAFYLNPLFSDPSGGASAHSLDSYYRSQAMWRLRKNQDPEWSQWLPFRPDSPLKLEAGFYELDFQAPPGFRTPPRQSLRLPEEENLFLFAPLEVIIQPPSAGNVKVTLTPNPTGAAWRILGESEWHASGETVSNLATGIYPVEFKHLRSWQRPEPTDVTIEHNQLTTLSASYRSLEPDRGSLAIVISQGPSRIVSENEWFWRVKGDTTWRPRGFVYESLPPGPTTVEFRDIYGWLKPQPTTVTLLSNQTVPLSISYVPDPATLYRVIGRVNNNGAGVADVTINGLPPEQGAVTTDENGWFRAWAPDGYSGTLSATKAGFSFSPAAGIPIAIQGKHLANRNFFVTGTASTTDREPPSIKLLAPGAGEVLSGDTAITVRWLLSDDSGYVANLTLDYQSSSTNFVWQSIAELHDPGPEYTWQLPELVGETVRLRLTATDGSGNSAFIRSPNFRVVGGACSRPESPPFLKNPGVSTPHDYLTVDWLDVSGSDSYRLQVDTHPLFTNPTEYTAETSYHYLTALSRGEHFFRVKAHGACGQSAWSETESIQVLANEAPLEPFSPQPSEQAANIPLNQPFLSWACQDPDGDALVFDVYMGRDLPLSKICSDTSAFSCAIPSPLLPGKPYFWKVVAIDALGKRTSSPIWTFSSENRFPDLAVSQLQVSNDSPEYESQFSATVNVANIGNDPSGSNFVFFHLQTPDGSLTYELGKASMPALAVGQNTTVTKTITLPPGFLGPVELVAVANPYNQIKEDVRTNNTVVRNLSIVDSQGPTVTVHYPSLDFVYRTGHEMKIVYSERDNQGIDSQEIFYSADGGPWINIWQRGYICCQGFKWLVPDSLVNAQVTIKVVVYDQAGNFTEALSQTVPIISGEAPQVAVLFPVGGEQLLTKNTYTVRWEATSPLGIQSIDVDLYRNGTKERTLALNLPNTGTYEWTVPSSYSGQEFTLAVEAKGTNFVDTLAFSQGPFTVVDSFVIPPPWNTPIEAFTLPTPPPIPPNAYAFGNNPPKWDQYLTGPQMVSEASGKIHLIIHYAEHITLKNPSTNQTYKIGNYGFLYRTFQNGVFSPQSKTIFTSYDVSTGLEDWIAWEDFSFNVGSDGVPHLVFKQTQEIPNPTGGAPTFINSDVFHSKFVQGSWVPRINVSNTTNSSSSSPTLAITANGLVHIAWREKQAGHSQIWHLSLSPSTGLSPILIAQDYAYSPTLIALAENELYLTAESFLDPHKLLFLHFDGTQWSNATTIRDGSAGGHPIHMTFSPSGALYVYLRGPVIMVNRWEGDHWRQWDYAIPDAISYGEAQLFFDPFGNPHLSYQSHALTTREVLVERRIYEDGSFGPLTVMDSIVGRAENHQVTTTTDGGVFAIWNESISVGDHEPVLLNWASYSDDLEAPQVTVNLPQTNALLPANQPVSVAWSAQDNVGVFSVTLKYSTDQATSFQTIEKNLDNSGTYQWTPPAGDFPEVILMVEARDANGNLGRGYSGTFSLQSSSDSLTLVHPNGGEALLAGQLFDIEWASSPGRSFSLEVSLDDGLRWTEIANGLSNTATYSWQVPTANTSRALVRVRATASGQPTLEDQSDASFIIQPITGAFEPYAPNPAIAAGYVSPGTVLSWSGGHAIPQTPVLYKVRLGTTPADMPQLCQTIATQCALPKDLLPNQAYYWQVVADDGQILVQGPIWTFSTGAPNGLIPPEQLVLLQSEQGSVDLSWHLEAATGLSQIERKSPGESSFQVIAQVEYTTTFSDTTTMGNRDYVYRIRTQVATKTGTLVSDTSNEAHVATSNRAPLPPNNPSPVHATEAASNWPILQWQGGDPDPEDPITYTVYFARQGQELAPLGSTSATTMTLNGPLTHGSAYHWQILARDAHGSETKSPIWSFATPTDLPIQPEFLVATQDDFSVQIGWFAALNAGDRWVLERQLVPSEPYQLIQEFLGPLLEAFPLGSFLDTSSVVLANSLGSDHLRYRLGTVNQKSFITYGTPIEIELEELIPVSIVSQPQSQTLCPGEDLSLTLETLGSGPLTYQWYFNQDAIPGATDSTLVLANLTTGQVGGYACTVSSPLGSETSQVAMVVLEAPPMLIAQAPSQSACLGETISFSIQAGGSDPLSFQWFLDGEPIAGASGATLVRESLSSNDEGTYFCRVQNACGSIDSEPASLTLSQPPTVLLPSPTQLLCRGDQMQLQAEITSSSPFTIQWRRNGEPLPGETQSILTIPFVEAATYDCIVSNPCGSASSLPITLNPLDPITIAAQPSSQTACLGDLALFQITATGNEPIAYQWFHQGFPIEGATSPYLAIDVLDASVAGLYHCEITNTCGNLSSEAVPLTLEENLRVQARSGSVAQGILPLTLEVAISCADAPTQWYWQNLSTQAIFGEQNNPVTLDAVLQETTRFQCHVTDTTQSASAEFLALVAVDPFYFDPNSDGCNSLADLLFMLEAWGGTYPQNNDPNGDGSFDVRDFLYLNLGTGTPCP